MSMRGSFVSNPSSKPKLISESKSYIPLCWLAFLSMDDVSKSAAKGIFELDCREAIAHAEKNIPFLVGVFSDLDSFDEGARALLDKLTKLRSKTIGIDVSEFTEFVDEEMPDLSTIVDAIESQNSRLSINVPARTVVNPMSGDKVKMKPRKFKSTRDVFLHVCNITDRELSTDEMVREYVAGYVWD